MQMRNRHHTENSPLYYTVLVQHQRNQVCVPRDRHDTTEMLEYRNIYIKQVYTVHWHPFLLLPIFKWLILKTVYVINLNPNVTG